MIVIPGKTFLPGPEEVSEPEASPDSAADPLETAVAGGPAAAVVPFDPGSFPDASRFGSGETAKRPFASPGGAESAGSATAGIGVSARKVRKSGPFTGTGEVTVGGSTFNCSTGFGGSGGLCEGSGDLTSGTGPASATWTMFGSSKGGFKIAGFGSAGCKTVWMELVGCSKSDTIGWGPG